MSRRYETQIKPVILLILPFIALTRERVTSLKAMGEKATYLNSHCSNEEHVGCEFSPVTLGAGGLAEKHMVLVVKGLMQECLLGANFLMQKMSLLARGKDVGFNSQSSNEKDLSINILFHVM